MLRLRISVLLVLVFIGFAGLAQAAAPSVVESNPVDGATGVAVDIGRIEVTFDRNMKMNAHSLLQVPGAAFPPLLQNGPSWESPTRCVIRIGALQPETRYALRLNSATKKGFQDAEDQAPLPPTLIRFTTGPAMAAAGGSSGIAEVQPDPSTNPPPVQFPAPGSSDRGGYDQTPSDGGMPYSGDGSPDPSTSALVGTWLVRTNEFEILAILNADGTFQRWLRTMEGSEYTQGYYQAGNGVMMVYPYDDEPTRFNYRMPDYDTLEVTDDNGDGVRMIRQGGSPLGAVPLIRDGLGVSV